MNRNMFSEFADRLARYGGAGANNSQFLLSKEGKYSLQYVPFEHVNKAAKLVIVGITPGPNQIGEAYDAAQKMINAGKTAEQAQIEVKKLGAFSTETMRPNLVKMLNHFGFDRILGIGDVNSLWRSNAHLLHSTSVVSHAAFYETRAKGNLTNKPFAGDLDEVLACKIFRDCFESCFLPSLTEINPDAMYIGLGKCPEQALEYAVQNGFLRKEQVLGAFSHPSTNGGSSVGYYLREKRLEDMSPKDPVRSRTEWLDAAYAQMSNVTASLRLAT
jgi:hypothetical protein